MRNLGRQTQRIRTNISLRSIRHIGSSRDKNGLPSRCVSKILKHRALVEQASTCKERREIRLEAMSIDERRALKALQDSSALPTDINEDSEDFTFGDVWDGSDALPISHAGGEFGDLARGVLEEVWRLNDRNGARTVRCDNRTRRDRVLRRNDAFNEQVPALSEAYLLWSLEKSQKGFKNFFDRLRSEETDEANDLDGGQWPMMVVDAFFAEKLLLKISSRARTIASAMVEFHRHLSRQFSIAFDLYHQIRRTVASVLMTSLQRDSPDWRLKHACPACTYLLTDEDQLRFKMLYAMDGNDSLKRVIRRSLNDDDDDDNNNTPGTSSELPTASCLLATVTWLETSLTSFRRTHHAIQGRR
ncbi:hypothetical protein EDD22DRAFT_949807 [Suillus occidentalis]|nr:hypothetical protein EDD22DRAFT_949807 [Suillus occidentalis]